MLAAVDCCWISKETASYVSYVALSLYMEDGIAYGTQQLIL